MVDPFAIGGTEQHEIGNSNNSLKPA